MCRCAIEVEKERSYRLVLDAVNGALFELQKSDEVQFDVLHRMVVHANSLFDGFSKLGVEDIADSCRRGFVADLCMLFSGEISREETISRLTTVQKSLVYSMNERPPRKFQNRPFPKKMPEIEHHSFFD